MEMAEQQHNSTSPKRRYQTLHCPRSNREVAKSTWYLHHRKYYDRRRKKWLLAGSSAKDFNFDSSADEEDDGDPEECCISQEQLEGTESDEVRSINYFIFRN